MDIIDVLKNKALQIKNELQFKANSALRIGGLFEDIVNYLGSLGSMAKVNDVTTAGKKFARSTNGWEEITTGGGESLMELDGEDKIKPKDNKTIDASHISGITETSQKAIQMARMNE